MSTEYRDALEAVDVLLVHTQDMELVGIPEWDGASKAGVTLERAVAEVERLREALRDTIKALESMYDQNKASAGLRDLSTLNAARAALSQPEEPRS